MNIYSPEVKRHAELFGITELQAYRNLQAATILRNRRFVNGGWCDERR